MPLTHFPYPDDLSRFPKETQKILRMVHDLGWDLRWQGNNRNVVTARCPSGEKTINFPRTNINANRVKSWVHMIERYSDPERFAEWIEDNTDTKPEPKPTPAPSPAPARPPVPDTAVAAAMREAAEKAVDTLRPIAEEAVASRTRDTAPARPDDYVKADTRVVTEKPWLARRGASRAGTGKVYESPHVIERKWSDGATDYRCRWCPYTNENPRSVATHARKHPERRVPQPVARSVEHYVPTDIKRPMSAVRRLSSDLLHALDTIPDWQGLTREDLAHLLAERVYDERPDREPAAPLTPEQIIARIVGLVDMGRLADLHQKVDDMAAQVAAAEQRAEAERDHAAHLQQQIEALREERRALAALLSDTDSEAS